MNNRTLGILVALGLLGSASALAQTVPVPRPVKGSKAVEQCAEVSGVARMEGYGYSHVVELKNNCDRPVVCEVWTDVDPDPRFTLKAKPGETDSATTRRGSPAREFKAEKSCKYAP